MIKKFLNYKINDDKFLISKDRSITRKEFVNHVDNLKSKIIQLELEDEFIYLEVDEAIDFYILLFACWISDKKVVLPTKLSLENSEIPKYVKYIIKYSNNNLIVNENGAFNKIDIPNGDTIVFSSGSTGKPKGVVHKKDDFFINALETLKLLNLEKKVVSLTFLKPYLVSAISHMLVHWYNESILIFDELEKLVNISKYKIISNHLNIVGSPIHIIASMKHLKDSNINPKFFFSSGDMISDANIKQILKLFDNTIFFKVYGLAEVAGRLFIKTITKKEKCYDIGKHLSNIEVKYIENEVVVRTDILFLGYIKDNVFYPQRGVFYTGDLVDTICNDKKVLKGRKNDEVKIGGHKVITKYLENIILSNLKKFLNIDLVIIIPISHHLFGKILALVLATKNNELKKNEIIKLLRQDLTSYEIPHKFYFIDLEKIPFTQSMKVDRNKIKEMIFNNQLSEVH